MKKTNISYGYSNQRIQELFAQQYGITLPTLETLLGSDIEHFILSHAPPMYKPQILGSLRKTLRVDLHHVQTRKQLFLNLKGGTGKTSLSVGYAFRLAELGYRVLLIDLDSQGHAAQCLGYEAENLEQTLFDALTQKISLEQMRIETALPELHLVPSNLRMATIDWALMPVAHREYRLRKAIETVEKEYDFVIMDAPPAFGLLNLNAIIAAQDLFVPVLPDFLSYHGLRLLFDTVDDIQEDLEHTLDRIMVVVNQFGTGTTIAKNAFEALKKNYGDYLLDTTIRQCTKFAQASSKGIPISIDSPDSRGAQDIQAMVNHTLGFLSKECTQRKVEVKSA